MVHVSYLKVFSFTCSIAIHEVGRKTPNSVSNYLPSCSSKFDFYLYLILYYQYNFQLTQYVELCICTQLVEKKTTFI